MAYIRVHADRFWNDSEIDVFMEQAYELFLGATVGLVSAGIVLPMDVLVRGLVDF